MSVSYSFTALNKFAWVVYCSFVQKVISNLPASVGVIIISPRVLL